MIGNNNFSLQATASNGEPLKVFILFCFNKVDGSVVTFRTITQTAGVQDELKSVGGEIY